MGQNCHPYSYGLPKLKLVSDFQGGKNQKYSAVNKNSGHPDPTLTSFDHELELQIYFSFLQYIKRIFDYLKLYFNS